MKSLRQEAEEILAGIFRKFELPGEHFGFPPQWSEELPGRAHPILGHHWSHICPYEDIKLVWELSRMGWCQILGRAYAIFQDERYAEAFWQLFEDWCANNPPNHGPQWMCGQEAAIRSMALALGYSWFRQSPATTPERLDLLVQVLLATGRRIAPHIHYALSQRNNHAINEALGLMTAATFVPWNSTAASWARIGDQNFQANLLDQLDEEGSYIQHSTNYHRVLIHACTWRLLLSQAQGRPIPSALLDRMRVAMTWMVAMVDPRTGLAPNLGSNDGANVLRLASAAFTDQRSSLQGLAALLGAPLPYPPGPWDEPILWLTGRDPMTFARSVETRDGLSAKTRGHFVRLNREGSLYFRCCTYRERPSQSDPLHVDLTWRGINVLCDAGTYRYNAPSPWVNSLALTGMHNTVTIKGRPSMNRIGPFLWLGWDRATLLQDEPDGWLTGERQPSRYYPLTHRRHIQRLRDTHWLIVDDVLTKTPETFCLHWLLPNQPFQLSALGLHLDTPQGPFMIATIGPGQREAHLGSPDEFKQGMEFALSGLRSSCYSQLEPAISFTCTFGPSRGARWVTVAGEGRFTISLIGDQLHFTFGTKTTTQDLPPLPYQENPHGS